MAFWYLNGSQKLRIKSLPRFLSIFSALCERHSLYLENLLFKIIHLQKCSQTKI